MDWRREEWRSWNGFVRDIERIEKEERSENMGNLKLAHAECPDGSVGALSKLLGFDVRKREVW